LQSKKDKNGIYYVVDVTFLGSRQNKKLLIKRGFNSSVAEGL